MIYLTLPDVLILSDRACLIFPEFLLAMKASLAPCMASKLLLTILLADWQVRAGTFLFSFDGNFGFLPIFG